MSSNYLVTAILHSIFFAADMCGRLTGLFVFLFLLDFRVIVLAKDDPKYDPTENFRPDNVTGLSGLYAWVGS